MCESRSESFPEIQCQLGRTGTDHSIHTGFAYLDDATGRQQKVSDSWPNPDYIPQVTKTKGGMLKEGLKLAESVKPERRTTAIARPSDPETSHDAAMKLGDLTSAQDEVLELLRQSGPSTDEEILRAARLLEVKQTDSGLRTRRSELEQAGLVEWTGERRLNGRGNQSRVWRVIEEVPGGTLS